MESSEFNIANIIIQTINTLISNLFSSIDNNLYSILDDLVFINSDIMKNPHLVSIFNEDASSSLIVIANSLVIGFLIYYSMSYLLSHFTFTNIQNPMQIIFKLILCTIAINFSYFFCNQIVFLNSTVSLAIREVGENIFSHEICFSSLLNTLTVINYDNQLVVSFFSFDGIIKSIISIGLLNLSLSYSLRYVMVLVFILISPFAFLSLILPNTSWIFKTWLKTFLSLLFLQLLIPLILIVSFSFNNSSDMLSHLIHIGSIYALTKANHYIKEFMGGLSTDVNIGISNIKSMISGG